MRKLRLKTKWNGKASHSVSTEKSKFVGDALRLLSVKGVFTFSKASEVIQKVLHITPKFNPILICGLRKYNQIYLTCIGTYPTTLADP